MVIIIPEGWDETDWAFAHYDISNAIDCGSEYTVEEGTYPRVTAVESEYGKGGLYDLSVNLTNQFLHEHPADTVGDGEWPDLLEAFLDKQLNINIRSPHWHAKPEEMLHMVVTSTHPLRSGHCHYSSAICISVDPFVVASLAGDMRWQSTVDPKDFYILRKASEPELENALKRLDK